MNKINLLGMNVVFFTMSRVSGLASIVTAIKFSKISTGAQPWRGSSPSAPPPPILYAYDIYASVNGIKYTDRI